LVNLAKSLTQIVDVKAAPLKHGKKYEAVGINRYMQDTGNTINPCGLVVSIDFLHTTSSPDGKVTNDLIIEVKCAFVSRDTPDNTTTSPFLRLDGNGKFYLDQVHNYSYQIQGQLLCTCAKECILVICHADNLIINDIKYVTVCRDDQFIKEMVVKLSKFYQEYFQPALLDKLFYRPYIAL
jgi:hypothetical protein